MKEKSCAYGSSGGLRRAGWTLTAGGTGDKRWGSGGEGVDVDYPLVNVDDVRDGVRELERAARQGFAGAMITEYPPEDRRYDQPEYEILWAAAQDLDMPLSLHTATRRQGKIRGVGPKTLRDASSRATKAFGPATSMCDMIFSGVFERYPRLQLAIVEFELAWAPHMLSSMDYTYRERHEEAIYRFKDGMVLYPEPTDNSIVGECGKLVLFHPRRRGPHHGAEPV